MEDSPFLQGSTSYSAATGPGGRHGGVHLANASGQDLLLDESIDLTEGTPRSNVVGTDDEDRFELGAPRRKEDGKGKGRLEDDVLSSTGIYAGHPNRVSQPISKPVNNAETPELDKLSLQQKHGEASSTMPFNDQQESPAGTRSQEGGDDQEEPAEKEARLRQTREQRRRDALISERDQLRQMNTVLEKATEGLERAIPKVANLQESIQTSHRLLDIYTRVMSQTEHTRRLLLDGQWEMSRDLEEIQAAAEAEIRAKQEEEERIRREKREREERERREREELERKAALASHASTRGRGGLRRGTGTFNSTRGRGTVSSTRGSTTGLRGTASGTSRIGTTSSSARGQGRGL